MNDDGRETRSGDVSRCDQCALKDCGWIRAEWRTSELGRRAKFCEPHAVRAGDILSEKPIGNACRRNFCRRQTERGMTWSVGCTRSSYAVARCSALDVVTMSATRRYT